MPFHPQSPDLPRFVSSGQLSFTRPTAVRAVDDDPVPWFDVTVLGLLIVVDCRHVPDALTTPIVPTVLEQAVVDVARVLPAVPPFACRVKSENPVTLLATPALPVTVPPDALEKVPVFVVPPLPTTIVTVAADVSFAITWIVPPTPPCA